MTTCPVCSADFTRKRPEQRFCGRACAGLDNGRRVGRLRQPTGRDDPKWKGGSPGYRGPGWRTLSRAIRERDGWRCRDCGEQATGKRLQVHHLVPAEDWTTPGTANDPDNLLSLCVLCHQKRHKGERDPEADKARRRAYYLANRTRILARVAAYQRSHR